MGLKLYRLADLVYQAKHLVRQGVTALATENGTDVDLLVNTAARLLYGGQVAGQNVFDQIDPATCDAESRDRFVDTLGIVLEKPATPARGLMAIITDMDAPYFLPVGTEIELPGEAFHDGEPRAYKLLESVDCPGRDGRSKVIGEGTTMCRVRAKDVAGVSAFPTRATLRVAANGGASTSLTAVRRSNPEDGSVDLVAPMLAGLRYVPEESIEIFSTGQVVAVECTTPGKIGNAPMTRAHVDVDGLSNPYAILFGSGGGADEIAGPDADTARLVGLIEDTIACPPSMGNVQHWREMALRCPDVDLDDAVVYQHLRGPGTIDVVCIGRSGYHASTSFPAANLSYCGWGGSFRRIGEVQAAKVESWLKSQSSYFDDLKCHSVEWDYRGNTYAEYGFSRFFSGLSRVDAGIVAEDGYGPDSGVKLDVISHERHESRLYPARGGAVLDERLKIGHRVWVNVAHASTTGLHPFASFVTEIVGFAKDRTYAFVPPMSGLVPAAGREAYAWMDSLDLRVFRWGTAGPLTQPVIDAVYAHFDRLGPGGYKIPPRGPAYVQRFWPAGVTGSVAGVALQRWPAEGRRWSSGLRGSELRADILAVPGVRSVVLGALADGLLDFDPLPLHTLALAGVIPRYV